MAELPESDRLLPCLLERLIDDHPEVKQESREQSVVSLRRYREGVRRDIDWLLNASCKPPEDAIHERELGGERIQPAADSGDHYDQYSSRPLPADSQASMPLL